MRSRHEERSLIKAANWFFEAEMFSVLKHHREMRNTREIRRRAPEALLWRFRESWGGGARQRVDRGDNWVGRRRVSTMLARC